MTDIEIPNEESLEEGFQQGIVEGMRRLWQPIETVKKEDGTDILVWCYGLCRVACWNDERQAFVANVHSFVTLEASHWMPAPEAPNPSLDERNDPNWEAP